MSSKVQEEEKSSMKNLHSRKTTEDFTKSETQSTQHRSETPYYIFVSLGVDLISYLLILIVILGSIKIALNLDEDLEAIKAINPDFELHKWSDLLPSLYYCIPSLMINKLTTYLLYNFSERNLEDQYLRANDQEIIKTYSIKVCTNIFKGGFYLGVSIVGYFVLRDLDFMPTTLLGSGEYSNIFKAGYPNYFIWDEPIELKFFYNICLTFAYFDLYVLLSNPFQSDFLMMVLHHFSTISLLTLSYLTGYSHVGAVIGFLHYFGDVFSYVVRTYIYLRVPGFYKLYSTILFLIVFSYTRLYVFGGIILDLIDGVNRNFKECSLILFLIFLIFLHLLWTIMISKKVVRYIQTGNVEEIYKIKLPSKKEK